MSDLKAVAEKHAMEGAELADEILSADGDPEVASNEILELRAELHKLFLRFGELATREGEQRVKALHLEWNVAAKGWEQRIRELEEEVKSLSPGFTPSHVCSASELAVMDLARQLEASEQRLKEAREALAPVAALAEFYPNTDDSGPVFVSTGKRMATQVRLTGADCHRARKLLAGDAPNGSSE